MHIITTNTCSECCYCIEDYENFGLCCKDNTNKHIRLNQSACRCFCSDNAQDPWEHNTLMPDGGFTTLDELDSIPDEELDED